MRRGKQKRGWKRKRGNSLNIRRKTSRKEKNFLSSNQAMTFWKKKSATSVTGHNP